MLKAELHRGVEYALEGLQIAIGFPHREREGRGGGEGEGGLRIVSGYALPLAKVKASNCFVMAKECLPHSQDPSKPHY